MKIIELNHDFKYKIHTQTKHHLTLTIRRKNKKKRN